MRLDGMVALITGASRGLGRALALAFAREGTSLALCSRGQDALEQVAALGSSVLAVPVDLRSTRDLDRLVALTLDRYERVDILVNNASQLGPTPLPYLADYPPAAFDDAMHVNLVAPYGSPKLSSAAYCSAIAGLCRSKPRQTADRGSQPARIQKQGFNDPNRTSFELQMNSEMAIWLAGAPSADVKRTVDGRITDA